MKPLTILLLDDETRLVSELAEYLQNAGFETLEADRPSTAFRLIDGTAVDVAIVDIKLPEYDGLEFLRRLKASRPEIETIVMSGHGDMDSVIEAFRLGAFDYLKKPFASIDLQASIARTQKYIGAQRSSQQYAELCATLNRELAAKGEFVGASKAMRELRETIALAASHSGSPVLISGESGTGKELVARRIHAESPRAASRFLAVNCAAIPRDMFESEFFGHEKGAFTDARMARDGLFRAASGGSLFLDEVGELPLEAQSKLLRVIEEGKVRPVGSDAERDVDVRIICATNRKLAAAIEAGTFRRDLYYRLAVIEIAIPPLRERIEDIGMLAEHFLAGFGRRSGDEPLVLSPEFRRKLESYPFPGNVRELRNMMERAFIRGVNPVDMDIGTDQKPLPGLASTGSDQVQTDAALPPDTGLNLETLERQAILRALQASGGVLSRAADLLGITRQALDRRLEKYSLP